MGHAVRFALPDVMELGGFSCAFSVWRPLSPLKMMMMMIQMMDMTRTLAPCHCLVDTRSYHAMPCHVLAHVG